MDELRNMTLEELIRKMNLTDEEFEEWFQELGLLHKNQICYYCGTPMKLYSKKWTCNVRRCRIGNAKPKKGFKHGTFFERSRLSSKSAFIVSYMWCHKFGTIENLEKTLSISRKSIVQWNQYFRDICSMYFQRYPVRIGGSGTIVEVDETCFAKSNQERGRLVRPSQWLFGGVERETNRCFLVHVARRDAATLIPLIEQHILPGTTIMSDMWRASKLSTGFKNLTAKHSINFVDPATGAHTRSIESMLQKFKATIKTSYDSDRRNIDDYLHEFMWRREFIQDPFFYLWQQISEFYPCRQ